jgi:hypothetical protein
MTRTEDRLTDALHAAARSVREETLHPLIVPVPAPPRWGRRLAPIAAAAAVALIAVLALILPGAGKVPPANHGPVAGPPHYYVVDQDYHVVVRQTGTGAITASLPNPFPRAPFGGMRADGVAAIDDREFIAAYSGTTTPQSATDQTRLYTFTVTPAGHVTGLALIRGGVLRGFDVDGAIAISPDGSRAALAVCKEGPPSLTFNCGQVEIMVINLRTGGHEVWTSGRLQRPGFYLDVPSISWAGGESLVFLGQWCQASVVGGFCASGAHDGQVRTLDLASGGGSLSQGKVLLKQSARYPFIVQAQLDPGGTSITIEVLRGPFVGPARQPSINQVIQVSLAAGGRSRLLYHGPIGNSVGVSLSSDASGRFWLLSSGWAGWLDHGKLHLLEPRDGAIMDAW